MNVVAQVFAGLAALMHVLAFAWETQVHNGNEAVGRAKGSGLGALSRRSRRRSSC